MKKLHVAVVCLLLGMTSIMILDDNSEATPARGIADATITGTVVNGTADMDVIIKTMKSPSGDPPPAPYMIYFNTTTDATGSFSKTVDSRDTSTSPAYILDQYQVEVRPTYYYGLSDPFHQFGNLIDPGDTFTVPDGELEAFIEPVGNLTIKILNGSSGEPLEGVVVTVEHVPDIPDIPFSQVGVTDSAGETTFTDIRSVETSVEATKIHFRSLTSTVTENTVDIEKGGDTMAVFNLTENPWPFTTIPANGASSGNVSQGFLIDFGQEMDFNSMNRSSNYLFEELGGEAIPFSISIPGTENDRVRLVPDEPLDYDADYHVSILATIRSFGGGVPLWRTMDIEFHTEIIPSMVRGRVVEEVSIPVKGVVVNLVDQTVNSGADGTFLFPLVIPGTFDLVIEEGYIFHGAEVEDVEVQRGEDIDLGDILVTSRPRGSLNVTITSGGEVLPGAWVKILSNDLGNDEYNITTDDSGNASFKMVRSGIVNLKTGAPHHSQKVDVVTVPENGHGEITIDLVEDAFPVTIEIIDSVSPGVASATSDFLITPPEAIDFQTLNVTLWVLDGSGTEDYEIDLMQPQFDSGSGSYLVKVQGQLPLGKDLHLVIGDEMEAEDDGKRVLWRDMVFSFSTLPIPDGNLAGTILLEGKPLEGVELEFLDQTGNTEVDGSFNFSISLPTTSVTGNLVINLTHVGYQIHSQEITLVSGVILDLGLITMIPMDDWYTVSPADGYENVEPDVEIVMSFREEVMDQGNWSERIRIIRQNTSAPVTGNYVLNSDNRTIVFSPGSDLEENKIYTVKITEKLLLKNGDPMFPVGNITTFKIRPERIDVEVLSPDDISTIPVDIDGEIRLSFGVSVKKEMIEGSLEMEPAVSRISFTWISGSEVVVSSAMASETDYVMSLEPGRYGMEGQVLNTPFVLSFTTGTSYGGDHSFSSLNVIPDPEVGWEVGQTITISGTVGSSEGYQITVTMSDLTETTTVTENGTWTLEIVLPDSPFEGKLTVSIGTAGSPAAYSRDFDVDVREPGEVGDDTSEENNDMFIIFGVIVFLVLVILVVIIYMYSRKRSLDDSEVEYTDVDSDWSDDEE